MPGSSLWLVPPENHLLYKSLSELISEKLPASLSQYQEDPFPNFAPHLTLTSDILELPEDPQVWLNKLSLPRSVEVRVSITELDHGTAWTKKLFLRAEKEPLKEIGTVCRAVVEKMGDENDKAVQLWIEEEWDPHISLVYSNLNVTTEVMTTCTNTIQHAGIYLSSNHETAWTGGSVWLVPTYLAVKDWKPIAIRYL